MTFWGTLVANEVNRKLSNTFIGGNKTVWGPVPLPSYVPVIIIAQSQVYIVVNSVNKETRARAMYMLQRR